ncbi:MAG: hypothetical protein CMB80_03390 [Flammeovirgaceae bacterium]|jgi:hypothetical protein|nr:hypothetical protein [Flammeovirgaceae bacterium]|tara:strand:- start:166 stop:627 length:462 start_codon:yes stop_codon:yes gene_type:complete
MKYKELASKLERDWTDGVEALKGADNPNFTGGKYVDDKGYVRTLRPKHPCNNAGYIYEHRLIMEEFLGRYLESWETVHHINEIKEDNRMENIYLCTPQEHTAIHSEGRHISWKHKDKLRSVAHSRAAKKRKERLPFKVGIKKLSRLSTDRPGH